MASAADLAGIPVTTLRHWVESGKLAATAGKRGRLVRLADVRLLLATETTASPNLINVPPRAQTSAGPNTHAPAGRMGPAERAQTAIPTDNKVAEAGADKTTKAAHDAAAPAGWLIEPPAARQQRLAIVSNAAAFIAKLEQLYRAQIAAKDGEIAAKDELIAELRRRAERAEQHAAHLEQKLADLRAHAEVVETRPVLPASHPSLLNRLLSWYRRL